MRRRDHATCLWHACQRGQRGREHGAKSHGQLDWGLDLAAKAAWLAERRFAGAPPLKEDEETASDARQQ